MISPVTLQDGEELVGIEFRVVDGVVWLPALVTGRWNGFAVPSFRRDVVEVIIELCRRSVATCENASDYEDDVYSWANPVTQYRLTCFSPAYDDLSYVVPTDDDRYAVGASNWCWILRN
jgi:hypothetical protein